MPYVSTKMKLSETQDRRVKLTLQQKEEIKELYNTKMYSHAQLSRMFGCSASRIGQIVNPEVAAKVRQRGKEHWRDYQQKGEEWNNTVREHRRYKQKLYLNGELGGN